MVGIFVKIKIIKGGGWFNFNLNIFGIIEIWDILFW